jgi:hypothetical protein
MRLLDTPEWAALTTRQKNIMLAIQENGPLRFRVAQSADIKALENLGLIIIDWPRSVAAEPGEDNRNGRT